MAEAAVEKAAIEDAAAGQAAVAELGRVTDAAIPAKPRVTARAASLGLLLCVTTAALNCYLETATTVHFVGGVYLPAGAVFFLGALTLGGNCLLRKLQARGLRSALLLPYSSAELLTIYAMLLFAATLSTPGTDNFFITIGAGLFYFSTRENRWAELFYNHVPSWFAPGWDGVRFQREVIDELYMGGVSSAQIPWHAWSVMLLGWSVFLLLCYFTLFCFGLLLRRQWIENESLVFPLIEVPLRLVDVDPGQAYPPSASFWRNRMLWAGVICALGVHFLRAMNGFSPDWPMLTGFQGNSLNLQLTERPWNAIGAFSVEYFLGAVGVAYLLTREVSFSMWFFFWAGQLQLVGAEMIGYSAAGLPRDNYLGRANFITYQSIGGWAALAGLLLWTARGHLALMFRAAWRGGHEPALQNEPFAPRFAVVGFLCGFAGLLAWSVFAGINVLVALVFFTVYVMASLVLARLVVEGGMIFPQLTFGPLDWMTGSLISGSTLGAGNVTRLGFIQPVIFWDARTNTLPGWLQALKLAHAQGLAPRDTRRLLGASWLSVVVTLGVTIFMSIATLYKSGGLASYSWFTRDAPQSTFKGAAQIISSSVEPGNWLWFGIGALAVWGMTLLRTRFLWFPLHPLGYIIASGYPIGRLWFSFFLGWSIKTLVMRYGGGDAAVKLRPFMIGLILGNIVSMVLSLIAGFVLGRQIGYWPA